MFGTFPQSRGGLGIVTGMSAGGGKCRVFHCESRGIPPVDSRTTSLTFVCCCAIVGAVYDQSCPKQEWMPWLACPQSPPKLGGDALAKRGLGRSVQNPAKRLLMNFREADRINKERCAEIHKVACAIFEQTAPPSLREGTPPNLGGDWSTSVTAKPGLHRIHYIQTFTSRHSAAPRPFCLGHVWSMTAGA